MKQNLLNPRAGIRLLLVVVLQMYLLGATAHTVDADPNTDAILQQKTISGKVTDQITGEGLPGVNILIKGTGTGTVTDMDGNYKLEVPQANAVLVFSYIGYITEEIAVGNSANLSVQLAPDLEQLDEVVVIGYGEVERSDLTGSVASLDSKTIQRANKVNAFQAMQGQVPGVNIQAADNKPGGSFNIRIRGSNTINYGETVDQGGFTPGQNPLFVVNGIFVNDISFLNPSDIERMDILKDASATAIYGSRGTNGVVIIQTKKGVKGKLSVQYDGYVGYKQAYNLPRIFNGPEFVQFMKDAVVGREYAAGNYSLTPDDVDLSNYFRSNELENIENGNYTDWVDLVLQNGFQTNHTFGVSGGSENTTFGLGLGYTEDEGNFPGENYRRINLRGDINSKLSDIFTIGYSNYITFSVRDEGSREGFRSAYRLRPTGSPYDENGEPLFFPINQETFITNPLFEEANEIRETRSLNYLGNISLAANLMKGMKFTTSISPNLEFRRFGEYRGQYAKSTSGQVRNRRAHVDNGNRMSYTWDNILNYNLDINENNSLAATLVYSRFLDRYENYWMQRRNFTTDQFLFYNIDAGSDVFDVEGTFSKQTLESYTGRLNYNLMGKYLLTITGRYDGASILAENNKWAFFPSAAFAWKIMDEGFMQDQNIFHDLKLRLSYGQTGNNGGGGGLVPLGSLALIGGGFTNLGGQVVQTAFVNNLPNPNLTWERTTEYNVGLDYGLVKNRIYGSIDVYNRKTTGIIFPTPVSTMTGFYNYFENVGEATNKGIEIGLNTINVATSDFTWNTNINFARNKNEITKLYGGKDIIFSTQAGSYIQRVGEPVGANYTWVYDGIWQMDEVEQAKEFGQQPGQVKVKDINGDGVLDEDDRTVVGVNLPDWTGGITNTLGYKKLDLSFFVYTNQGGIAHSYFHRSHAWDADAAPARFNGLQTNYWTPTNPSNEWYQPGNSGRFREPLLYKDVSFVKVGFITLGYTLPESVVSRMKMSSFRAYITAQNPFVFTDYEGWDPENAARNSWGSAAMSRTLMVGVNARF
jgi:TonB-linked SusC/RagA family outer membrane protein